MVRTTSQSIATAVHGALAARSAETIETALRSVHPEDLAVFFHTSLDDVGDATTIGTGLPASPGAASGRIVLSADAAIEAAASGEDVILVRPETSPDDVVGMQAAKGIVTHRGGLVSHAAVVARGWGIPAVVGAPDVHFAGTSVTIGTTVLEAGDMITIDGSTGNIYLGALDTFGSVPPPELDTLLAWADDVSRGHIQVRANADTADDATFARILGAQGIGLCRTEHMFLAADRLPIMRRLILSQRSCDRGGRTRRTGGGPGCRLRGGARAPWTASPSPFGSSTHPCTSSFPTSSTSLQPRPAANWTTPGASSWQQFDGSTSRTR